MRTKARSSQHQVAEIASRQHGVVTLGQLLDAGLSRDAMKRRVRKCLLHREHRGVYRVGHRAPSIEARYMAAVLACGEKAALSGPAAAYLFGLVKGDAPPPEVSAVTEHNIPGVATRHVRYLDPGEVGLYRAIPVTTVPRTLVDLAGCLSLAALARACHEAQVRHHITPASIDTVLARRPNAPGAGKLHEVFTGQVPVTLSKLERDFLGLLRSAGLPAPQTNRLVGRRYVDCRWPRHGLTIELDSYRYHHTRHAWEQDRRREREARAGGDEYRRYTYGDVNEDQALMLAELRELLLGGNRSLG